MALSFGVISSGFGWVSRHVEATASAACIDGESIDILGPHYNVDVSSRGLPLSQPVSS